MAGIRKLNGAPCRSMGKFPIKGLVYAALDLQAGAAI
jgi:hypothetical protein